MTEEYLTTDEAICAFHGHVLFCVYEKEKSYKYSIKILKLCKAKSGMFQT